MGPRPAARARARGETPGRNRGVTAEDFEYSWKRTLSPDLAADYAYQFYGIVGASEYNECKQNCDAMRDKVGIEAVDPQTLRVELTSPQPWFIQQVSHHSFLAVHQETVEQFGADWTEPGNIVTNGPFMLESWEHEATINLVKNIPNHNDDGIRAGNINTRQITGILVTGTGANPVLYVGSSDPRIGAGGGGNDLNLDPISAVI